MIYICSSSKNVKLSTPICSPATALTPEILTLQSCGNCSCYASFPAAAAAEVDSSETVNDVVDGRDTDNLPLRTRFGHTSTYGHSRYRCDMFWLLAPHRSENQIINILLCVVQEHQT